MAVKEFFKEKTEAAIASSKDKQVYRKDRIVESLLNIRGEGHIEINERIIPGHFFTGHVKSEAEAARRWLRDGERYPLIQPKDVDSAISQGFSPQEEARKGLREISSSYRKGYQPYIGFKWHGITQSDRRTRMVDLADIAKGVELTEYMNLRGLSGNSKVYPFRGSNIVGAETISIIPSTREGKPNYEIKLTHVPVDLVPERKAMIWNLDSLSKEGPRNMDYRGSKRGDLEDGFSFSPKSIAAYLDVCLSCSNEGNNVPLEMSPFLFLNSEDMEFYHKLRNNALVRNVGDGSLRKLYEAETSNILMDYLIGKRRIPDASSSQKLQQKKIISYKVRKPSERIAA